MSDPTPTPSSFPGGDWLLAMFNQLEARLTAHGRRMDDGFAHNETKLDALNQKFDDHALADAEMAKDIALIKQARQIEAQTLSRRGAAAGTVSGSILIIGYELLKHMMGWK